MITKKFVKEYLLDKKNTVYFYLITILFTHPLDTLIWSFLFADLFTKLENLNKNKKYIIKLTVVIASLFLLEHVANLTKGYLEGKYIPNFIKKFRTYIFDNVINNMKKQYKDVQTGDLISRLIVVPNAFDELLYCLTSILIPRGVTLFVVLIALFYINFNFGIITVIYLLLIIFFMKPKYTKCYNKFLKYRTEYIKRNENIQDNVSNLFDIYLANQDSLEKKNNFKKESNIESQYSDGLMCNLKNESLISVFSILYLFSLLFLVLKFLFENKLKRSLGITTLIIISYVVGDVYAIFSIIPFTFQTYSIITESEKFMKQITINKLENESIKKKIDFRGDIELKNVNFHYQKKHILKDINLRIKRGDKILIKGSSGSGKSTLIKLLYGFFQISSGKIMLENENIDNINVDDLRSQISMMNQNVKLFNKSVYENIQYGNNISKEIIDSFIKKNNIKVYNSIDLNMGVGPSGNRLSGGQKQMTNLLRSLLNNKKILILDEPSSALDNVHLNILTDLITKINKTIIVITHDTRFKSRDFTNSYTLANQKLFKND